MCASAPFVKLNVAPHTSVTNKRVIFAVHRLRFVSRLFMMESLHTDEEFGQWGTATRFHPVEKNGGIFGVFMTLRA